ncbi:HAUS augmin-like complex subunit 7 isoform X3 [Echinops telfairi]|uniref:HAUS augmin-like complex subunit 7 isoform X3 n=1 Tax=Echinops telfairi TaxID=9371 RepID=A0AC55CPM7_ECHTE|nr:HAUS augmin-like complex subunit 7 isoform X3 [Echinops telfairi]
MGTLRLPGSCKEDLDCPFLEGLHLSEPETILELLCRPSTYRMDILEWMCVQVCPCLQDKLSVLQGAPMEGKLQEMVGLCHELMLCGPDDLDLMKGNASSQKQLYFMDQMLAVIQSLRLSDLGGASEDQDFKDLKEKNEKLLGNLFSSPHMQALLQPECDPWPLDAQPVPEQQKDSVLADVEEKQMAHLVKQLQESTAKVQVLKAECKEGATAPLGDLSTLDQKLRLVISDFHQLIMAFLQVYDDELGGCCHRPEPGLHPCGPIIQAVYQSLTSCSQLMQSIIEVTQLSQHIEDTLAKQQGQANYWGGSNTLMSLATKLQEVAQKYKVFIEALGGGPQ